MKNFEKLDQSTFRKLDNEAKGEVKGGYYTAVSIRTLDPYAPTQPVDTIASEPSLLVEDGAHMTASLDTSYVDDSPSGGGWA